MITVDASVLVAAASRTDEARPDALAFLAAVAVADLPIHQPTLSLVEVAAAIARRTGDAELAQEAGATLLAMPGVLMHSLDLETSAEAAAVAARLLLRGADAIYAATALRYRSTLVTLDDEIRSRASVLIDVASPSEWLRRQQ